MFKMVRNENKQDKTELCLFNKRDQLPINTILEWNTNLVRRSYNDLPVLDAHLNIVFVWSQYDGANIEQ